MTQTQSVRTLAAAGRDIKSWASRAHRHRCARQEHKCRANMRGSGTNGANSCRRAPSQTTYKSTSRGARSTSKLYRGSGKTPQADSAPTGKISQSRSRSQGLGLCLQLPARTSGRKMRESLPEIVVSRYPRGHSRPLLLALTHFPDTHHTRGQRDILSKGWQGRRVHS